jgi:putative ABC transport system substrate-binding protein
MRRRDFIALLGAALAPPALSPYAAIAQQRLPVIGFLNTQSPEPFEAYAAAFRQGVKEAGFTEGQNVNVEYRWARGRYDELPALAADLANRRVSVIVTSGGEPAALAAKAAAPSMPIVFLVGGDPVRMGLVASFNRPGGNITGATQLTLMLDAKRLGLLRELLPKSATIAVMYNPEFPGAEARKSEVVEAARRMEQAVDMVGASTEAAIDEAFAELARRRREAVLIAGDPFFNSRRNRIIGLAARHSIPAIYEWRDFSLAGGLMSYGTILSDLYRQAGVYAGRILKGEKPADLPVLQPTKFELVLNLKTAKALGLVFPPGVLAIADEVIE